MSRLTILRQNDLYSSSTYYFFQERVSRPWILKVLSSYYSLFFWTKLCSLMKNMGCDQKLQNKSAQASWIENLLPIRAVLLEAIVVKITVRIPGPCNIVFRSWFTNSTQHNSRSTYWGKPWHTVKSNGSLILRKIIWNQGPLAGFLLELSATFWTNFIHLWRPQRTIECALKKVRDLNFLYHYCIVTSTKDVLIL